MRMARHAPAPSRTKRFAEASAQDPPGIVLTEQSSPIPAQLSAAVIACALHGFLRRSCVFESECSVPYGCDRSSVAGDGEPPTSSRLVP